MSIVMFKRNSPNTSVIFNISKSLRTLAIRTTTGRPPLRISHISSNSVFSNKIIRCCQLLIHYFHMAPVCIKMSTFLHRIIEII